MDEGITRKIKGKSKSEMLMTTYNRLIAPNLFVLVSGFEAEMFWHITERTLRFGKYSEVMTAKSFRTGIESINVPPILEYSDRWLRQTRATLRDRGLILYKSDVRAPVRYAVNVPGICRVLEYLYLGVGGDKVESLLVILRESKKDFEKDGLPTNVNVSSEKEGSFMDIEEAIQKARQKSGNALAKKKAKRRLSANNLREVLHDYCSELGVVYRDAPWTKKDFGSAKQFLLQCKRTGQDPKEILFDVCKYWGNFRTGMQYDDGKQIVLPETVSFWKFYQYRHQIVSRIETHSKVDHESGSELREAFNKRKKGKL